MRKTSVQKLLLNNQSFTRPYLSLLDRLQIEKPILLDQRPFELQSFQGEIKLNDFSLRSVGHIFSHEIFSGLIQNSSKEKEKTNALKDKPKVSSAQIESELKKLALEHQTSKRESQLLLAK